MIDRQPSLLQPLVKAATAVVNELAKTMTHQQAAITVHCGALEQHALQLGLGTLAELAKVHPDLAGLGEIDTTHPAVRALWAEHQLMPDDLCIQWWTYPLGDLYPTLSVESRKGRALCQTPWWVADLLLHTSYDRAVEMWDEPRVIDPSCGTGHLLLESWMRATRHRSPDGLIESADRVCGVDLDPYAVLIARYRMVVLGWGPLRHRYDRAVLRELPLRVVAADSLLAADEPLLERGRYQVVVANPPYITVKDPTVNEAIRSRYPEVCNGKYSVALPFHALMMELLVDGGWCAQLTANSFMKREFGKRYVEKWLPKLDMQWVIDTSGAYIPGHGTPTVILVHRNRAPSDAKIHTVSGVQGEPSKPDVPAEGLVWTAIRDAVNWRESAERLTRGMEAAYRRTLPPVELEVFEEADLVDELTLLPALEPVAVGKRLSKPRRARVEQQSPDLFGGAA